MSPRRRMFALLAAVGLLAAAGCSNELDTGLTNTGNNQQVQLKKKADLSFAVVSHGAAGDSFWTVVKNGAEQAGKDLGVKVNYQASGGDAAVQSQLIDAAVNQKVDGLVVSMANPDALKASIQRAVKAGIPVITINSGQAKSAEFGAIAHIGQDEVVAGKGAGAKLKEAGVTKMLCVIQEAGNIGLEQRCQGAKEGLGGDVQNLQVEGANTASVESTIQAKLQADKSINGILVLGPIIAGPAIQAVQASGSSAKIATFDLSGDAITAIEQGKMLFAVDQQQFLQGYLPIQFLTLYATNLNTIGGGLPVLTGPGYVTKENAAQVANLATGGTR
jgi:simple sugar transport system substrate-binding protein